MLGASTRSFSTRRRGYDRSEVDAYLREVARMRQHDREELRHAMRRVHELEEQLEEARREIDKSSGVVLAAARVKQKLLEEARERATSILRSSYEAAGLSPEAFEGLADLDQVELLAAWTEDDESPLVDLPSHETRYQHRSAHLPSIGAQTEKVLSDLAKLRSRGLRNS